MKHDRQDHPSPADVRRFYDKYVERQLSIGVNDRHRRIMDWLSRAGLHAGSTVLEIGCGVGTQTELIAQVVSKGRVMANDISPQSVAAAQQRLSGRSNVNFIVGDILTQPIEGTFDLIVLPDVLEHIPLAAHGALFAKLAQLLAPNGTIVVHIPSPRHIEWLQLHHPEQLQVIDQPVHIGDLAPKLAASGLYLRFMEHYDLWTSDADAAVMFVQRNASDEPVLVKSRPQPARKRMFGRLSRLMRAGVPTTTGRAREAVLFIVDWWPYPGNPHNGIYVWEHAQAVAKHRQVVVVRVTLQKSRRPGVSFSEKRDGPLVVCEAVIRTPVRRFGLHDALVRRSYRRIIGDLGGRFRFGLAHLHVRTPLTECFLKVAQERDLPVVVTEHSSYYHTGIRTGHHGPPEVVRERIRKWFAHGSIERVLPVSDDLARTLVTGFGVPQEQIAVVPNVAAAHFAPQELAPPPPFRIVLAARWSGVKDPLLFVEALRIIPDDVARILEVHWIGDGPAMAAVNKAARSLKDRGRIIFHGFLLKPDLAHHLRNAHLLVHPTTAENLPCIIIESLACGTPVLSHAVNGVPELVNTTNGVLCPPGDVQAFADALTRIVRGDLAFDRPAIAAAAMRFSQDSVARQLLKIYDEVLAAKIAVT